MGSAGEGIGLVLSTVAFEDSLLDQVCICQPLYPYIQGNNDQAENISMTAPVLVDMFPSTGSSHGTMPQKYQNNPPLYNQAHPVKLPKQHHAAAKRFGLWRLINDSNIHGQVLALKKSLKGTPWGSSMAKTKSEGPVPEQCCWLQLALRI
ncbi:unnamed protein product [Dovyalis caffra]|uniref:Uncharacterized protein n=1 Tax=Dovyalis caffra TaxID=77055 RepID=A0AAV1RKG9_9ROSI|nr:unnamed protein product [Dovyalis caffra]